MKAITSDMSHELFQQWYNSIALREICSVVCIPMSGRYHRINNFVEYLQENGQTAVVIDPVIDRISDQQYFDDLIHRSTGVLIVTQAERLLSPDVLYLLGYLLNKLSQEERGAIFFFELFEYQLDELPSELLDKLSQHRSYLQLFEQNQTYHFIDYLCEKFTTVVSPVEKEKIHHETGGQPWLIKEVIRQVKLGCTFDEACISDGYQYRCRKLWSLFPAECQSSITGIARKQDINRNSEVVKSLIRANYVDQETYCIPDFLARAAVEFSLSPLQLINGNISLHGVDLSHHFSKKEKK